ncbi:ABC transporter permease [Streptomyces sp. Ru71]|uniref:ABC transporter permease n=1 Tax=Streptomyces sp. Ru71 TaxID=2080746 RepID=UPI000CDE41EF|nr:FtsX-like permease family protein [Streptomyces sp. Ru71]POX57034.1 ABC transporter permease [Streptomyces sp. Ru71]
MLTLALRTVRTRWVSFAGSFLALCLGTALLTVMGLALAATLDAPPHRPERFAAAPVVVRGQDTLRVETPAGVRTRPLTRPREVPPATVAALRAVGDVVVDRSFAVDVAGGPGDLVGHPWPVARFAPYRLTAGRAPRAADEVVAADDWTAVGRRLRSDRGTLRVVGTVRATAAENPVFFTDARAARLAPRVVQLVVDAGPSAVRRAVAAADVRVLTGDARGLADPDPGRDARALTALNALFGTAGGVSGFVSVLVVASTFAFTVAQRGREFGLLRAAGATPGQVRRTVLAEALLVGTAASAAGCALGAYGAPPLVAGVVDGGLAPGWFAPADPPWHAWPYQLAFWAGLLVALGGAAAASWRAGRIAPTRALREASVDSRTLTWGRRVCGTALLLTAAGTLAHTLLTDPADLLHRKTYVSRPLLLTGALALLSPALLRSAVRLLAWLPARLPGALGMLARENTATSGRRTAAVAAPVLATVALTGCLLGTPAALQQARAAEAGARTVADFTVVPRGHALVAGAAVDDSGGIGTAVVARLRSVPGADVSPVRGTAVHVLEDGVALVTFDARAAGPRLLAATVRLPVTAGRISDLDDASIVVNEEWAEHTVGHRVTVRLGDGTRRTLRVAAVLATGTGDNGVWVTPANAPGAGVERIDVRVRSGADPAAVAAALRTAVRPGDGVRVLTRAQWLRESRPGTNATTRLGLFLVLGIALLYTGLSLANTLTMSTSGRAAEFRALRLAGATRAQILRLTALESLTVVAAGALLGLLVTFVTAAGTGAALALLSAPAPLVIPWPALGAATAACALLAVVPATATAAVASRR